MPSDGHRVFAVGGDPAAGGDAAVEEKQNVRVERKALKAELGGAYRGRGGVFFYASAVRGGELHAEFFVVYDLVYRVGEGLMLGAVYHHASDCKLSLKALAARLGGDDARQSIKVLLAVYLVCRGEGGRAAYYDLARGGKLHALSRCGSECRDGCAEHSARVKHRYGYIRGRAGNASALGADIRLARLGTYATCSKQRAKALYRRVDYAVYLGGKAVGGLSAIEVKGDFFSAAWVFRKRKCGLGNGRFGGGVGRLAFVLGRR